MRDVIKQLADETRPVAYCRLVATRGSTPQKAGAIMLVYANGSQAGTLGGGCVEAEVKRQAIAILAGDEPTVISFQLDHDYGWDDGLICGGRMDVLMWPVTDAASRDYFVDLCAAHHSGKGGTEAITFQTDAETTVPAAVAAPQCFLFDADGQQTASLSAGQSSTQVDDVAKVAEGVARIEPHGRPQVIDGAVYLPIEVRHRLVIVGGGHVGLAVAELAEQLAFDVCIVDDREEFVTAERFPTAKQRVCGKLSTVLPEVLVDDQTFCLIVTRGHNHDQEALFHLVNRGAKYVGMIGSRRKVNLIFENLAAEGVTQEALDAVHAPVGINIGSQTVAEIAVSIAAQLIEVRRNH